MMKKDFRKIWRVFLWLTGMLILVLMANIWYWVIAFDTDEELSSCHDTNQTVCFKYPNNSEHLDTWETRMQLSDDEEDAAIYTGTTFPVMVSNDNYYGVKDWTLRLDINQECYLSGFWCGGFEVHQFRNGSEGTFLVEDQMADISMRGIDYKIYSDTNLIHLLPGDYLIYLPSRTEKETEIKPHTGIGIGFIFYYQDQMDLSAWTMKYFNDLKMMDVFWFRVALVLLLLWTCALLFYMVLLSISKGMQKQMNSRIRNISIMSDLFSEAYMIDIAEDSAQLIKGDENNIVWRLTAGNVQQCLNDKICDNCANCYSESLTEFLDLSTVSKRLQGVASITAEYFDEKTGWCSLRFFRAGEEANITQVVFTVQDINEEKKKLREIEEKISIAEYKQNVSGNFLETVSFALNDISAKISEDGKSIMAASSQEEVKAIADRVVMNTRHMNLIQNTMLDLYHIESNSLSLDIHPYNIYDMVEELQHILRPFAEPKPFLFTFDIDNDIPKTLMGDRDRIEQILVILLFSSILMTEKGFVRFSLYGKQHDNEEELIFSIRDSAKGFTEAQLKEIHDFINGSSIETFDNASLVYLKIINGILNNMGSELKIVSVLNEGTDFYFTLKFLIP